jgi:hypothetical protein
MGLLCGDHSRFLNPYFLTARRNQHACIIPYCLPCHEPCAHYAEEKLKVRCAHHGALNVLFLAEKYFEPDAFYSRMQS